MNNTKNRKDSTISTTYAYAMILLNNMYKENDNNMKHDPLTLSERGIQPYSCYNLQRTY